MGQVVLTSVSKCFGTHHALRNVDLTVDNGELVSLLGPSGCGKTTLLRAIAGLTSLDAGRVEIGGKDVTTAPVQRRPIGMVFQSYALFPNLRVRDNIAFPLTVRHRPKKQARARVDELLELVGLEAYADRLPNQLSGGQQQRVALARALAPDPDVLLLDEPLSALDAQVRHRLRDEIRRVQTRLKTTTIFVTHDQSEALAISDRVAVMNNGVIEQCASPDEIYTSPATRFAAGFVGDRNSVEAVALGGLVRLGNLFEVPTAAPDGERVVCVFQPEDVKFSANGTGVEAIVETKIYLGSATRVYCSVPGENGPQTLVANMSSRVAAGYSSGDHVRIHLDPSHVSVFAQEGPRA